MTRIPHFCLLLLFIVIKSISAEQDINKLADQLNNYCTGISSDVSPPGRVGKAGPPGSPGQRGPAGSVNYTKVNEIITERFKEIQLEEKLNGFIETSCNIQRELSKFKPKSCIEVHHGDAKIWNGTGGVFDIYPGKSGRKIEVYCDVTTDGGGWIVFQRRMDGSENFERNWADYVRGFGRKDGEFWMGLETLNRLTQNGGYELRVDLKDWESQKTYALYTNFAVQDATAKYKITVQEYSGSAGDSLSYHHGHKFTTYDQDNDAHASENCAKSHRGGWWFNACDHSQLNGFYYHQGKYGGPKDNGVEWSHLIKEGFYSMKFSEMKFRPRL